MTIGMTERYSYWLAALANRDNTLVILTAIAFALVGAYVLVDRVFPSRLGAWIKRAYLIGGGTLFLFWLARSIF